MTNDAPELTPEQVRFYRDFGFLVLRGLLADELSWVEAEFESVFTAAGAQPDGSGPRQVAPFIDHSPALCSLLELPAVRAIPQALYGGEWSYLSSDGNLFGGDTRWHRDGVWEHADMVKCAIYLDPVDASTGALRVVPGSHRTAAPLDGIWLQPFEPAAYGVEPAEIPATPLESQPGDVVLFSHRLLHASFGGGRRRRMFTLNFGAPARTPAEVADLQAFIAMHVNAGAASMYGPGLVEHAPAERVPHLAQVLEHQGVLASLARERQAQPTVSGVV